MKTELGGRAGMEGPAPDGSAALDLEAILRLTALLLQEIMAFLREEKIGDGDVRQLLDETLKVRPGDGPVSGPEPSVIRSKQSGVS